MCDFPVEKMVYVMTDFTESNFKFWAEHPVSGETKCPRRRACRACECFAMKSSGQARRCGFPLPFHQARQRQPMFRLLGSHLDVPGSADSHKPSRPFQLLLRAGTLSTPKHSLLTACVEQARRCIHVVAQKVEQNCWGLKLAGSSQVGVLNDGPLCLILQVLKPFLDSGQLDMAIFDAVNDTTIKLSRSGVLLGPGTCVNPICVVANYLFDTLCHDIFQVKSMEACARAQQIGKSRRGGMFLSWALVLSMRGVLVFYGDSL